MTNHPIFESTISVTRLRELRQRYRADEASLDDALAHAIASQEEWEHMLRMMLIDQPVAANRINSVCKLLDDSIDNLQRDLVEIRAALVGLDQEIMLLELDRERRAAAMLQRRAAPGESQPAAVWSR